MTNKFDEMRMAITEARSRIIIADTFVAAMADIIEGRLRSGCVKVSTLKSLKKELKNFNIHTGEWMRK